MTDIREIRNALARTAPEYNVSRASLFGSYARGEQDETSDVDLVIELYKPLGFKRARLLASLQDMLGVSVDLIFGADQLYAPVRASFDEESIIVYEA